MQVYKSSETPCLITHANNKRKVLAWSIRNRYWEEIEYSYANNTYYYSHWMRMDFPDPTEDSKNAII